jgi:signal transduction histidine kinase
MEKRLDVPDTALPAPGPAALGERELLLVREIALAGLAASHPVEVFRIALARVAPLLDATFSSVFLRDEFDADLLRLVCAQNWPQTAARWLGEIRIRVGRGPTGRAVAEAVPVEVADVFADPELREWWDPARELGFTSLIALPLRADGGVMGALSFYFADARAFAEDERSLLLLVTEQIAATAERARRHQAAESARRNLEREVLDLGGRLRAADDTIRRQSELLANVSYELRTPLTAISGYGYLLGSGHAGELNEDQAGPIAKIQSAASVLIRMVDDLQELAELRLGRVTLDLVPVDAVELASHAVAAAGATPPDVMLRLAVPESPVRVVTDGVKVLRVLGNLLGNAYKFTTRGEVTLGVRATSRGTHDRWVEWSVQDTGIGIRPTDLEAIFDEFSQVDGSSTRLYAGTGLGLAVSLRLAQLLGGELEVESEFGRGSRFTLRLPAAPQRSR